MTFLRRGIFLLLAIFIALGSLQIVAPQPAKAAVNPSFIILDSTFENTGSMSVSQINNLLNSFSGSCMSTNNGYAMPDPLGYNTSSGKYEFGSNVSGGQAIYDIATHYSLNPQVILATLQKEQSIVTGAAGCHYDRPNPTVPSQVFQCNLWGQGNIDCTTACPYSGGCMNIAMGYGCPGNCQASLESTGLQLSAASWRLRFNQERAYGRLSGYAGFDAGDETYHYGGPFTAGYRQRWNTDSSNYYDGSYTTLDGTSVNITNGATASLYSYTPFLSGNTNFFNIFSGWFGSPVSPCYNDTNINGLGTGPAVLRNRFTGTRDSMTLTFLNNTGSGCVEAHTWNGSLQGWIGNTATNLPVVDPNDAEIISGNVVGDSRSDLILVKYRGGGSGKIELHIWDPTYQQWADNVATNYPAVDPANSRVIAADLTGDGRDELVLVNYLGTSSGKVEVFPWAPGYKSFADYIFTNYPNISPSDARVIASDGDGNGKDELNLVAYRNTGSNKIEIHTWTADLKNWIANTPTNYPTTDPNTGRVVAADGNGDGKDELNLVLYRYNTPNKIEIHTWNGNQSGWIANTATNHPGISN